MKINQINKGKEISARTGWGRHNWPSSEICDKPCDDQNGRGWSWNGNRDDWAVCWDGWCPNNLLCYCSRNYEDPNWGNIPDNVVRLYSGVEGTKRYNKIHYKDFGIGEYSYIGDDLNDATSSIAVPDGLVVILYEDTNFNGKSVTIKGDAGFNEYNAASGGAFRNLFRDNIESSVSSLKVKKDCDHNQFYFDQECDSYVSNKSTIGYNKRKTFCNLNKENAFSDRCTAFCNIHQLDCPIRTLYNRCARFNIPESECTNQTAEELKTKCVTYGFIDKDLETALANAPACTQSGVMSFEEECKLYNLSPSEGKCTADTLENTKTAKRISDEATKAREAARELSKQTLNTVKETGEQNLQQFKDTKNMILDLVNTDLVPPEFASKYLQNKETVIGGIGVVTSSLCVLSVILSVFLSK